MNTQSIDKMEYVSIEGRDCPLNKDQTEVMYKGEWLTIQQDQEGESYIMAGHRLQSIYLSLPTSQPPVSIDKQYLIDAECHAAIMWWNNLSNDNQYEYKKIYFDDSHVIQKKDVIEIYKVETGNKPTLSIDKEVLEMRNISALDAVNILTAKGFNPLAMEELYKALDRVVGFLADLNGSEWIKGQDVGSLDMKQRAKGLQSFAYKTLQTSKL